MQRTMSRGIGQSHCGGSADDQYAAGPNQPKSRSGPGFLSLSRCASCYNQPRRGGDGESSSSAEDSGPEEDWDSETESSSSSSCCSEKASSDAAEPESGGKDGDGREETGESRTKGVTRRAPLVKSFSLPASLTPRLTPLSLLPRPRTVVSTLHLQVLSQKHDNDASYIIKQHRTEREEEKTEKRNGGGREGINNLLPPQPFDPFQQPTLQEHQLTHQYQQQPQHFLPLSAQGQGLPPPLHTLPVLHPPALHTPLLAPNPPQTHLHGLTPLPCWYCYRMHFPYFPY